MLAALAPRLGLGAGPALARAAATAGLVRWLSKAASPTGKELQVVLEPLDGENEGVFFLSLSRPEARNSIGRQFLRELKECLYTVAQERTTRCVVVRSTVPGVFCAGADLKERAVMSQAETAQFVRELREAMNQLDTLPMPTVAVVDGFALGGGAELALACDVRVAGRDAQFAFPETRLGIIPGAGGTQRLPRIVGTSRAKELIFTGRWVGG
jgi:methylglutaconyl-CoA hydratase